MSNHGTLIRKEAKRFKVGETLYLYGCDTGDLYGLLCGAFRIDEIKNQSDTGVSFFLEPWEAGVGGVKKYHSRTYLVEFARTARLTRIRGAAVTYMIEETP